MSHEFRREYLLRLPLPLAQLYTRAFNAKDARSRHDNAFYLVEALVKLTAASAAMTYLDEADQGAPRLGALDRLLAPLALPSLGQWAAILRELARYFGGRTDAASHPLGGLWPQLDRPRRDLPGLLALYQRIKNGVDGAAAADQSCSLLQVLDALVQYRNGVFGHGGPRFPSFYEQEMGPLLFPAVNELLAEGVLDPLGPPGSRLVYVTELRAVDDDRVEVGLRELVCLQGERTAPLTLPAAAAAALAPNRVGLVRPGRPAPLRLDPLLLYRESDLAEEVLFLNRDRNGRQVEYLSYTTGRTERDRSTAPALAALLSRVAAREVSEADLEALAEQSRAETPSVEALFGPAPPSAARLGDYEVLGELGRGGMGVVYLVRQLSLGRLVALKMLPADLAGDETALARFRYEIRALARCDHPHIVKLLASGVLPDGRQYYAMEYVPGCDLEQVWRELSGSARGENASTLGGRSWTEALLSANRKRGEEAGRRAGGPPLPTLPPRVGEGGVGGPDAAPVPAVPDLPSAHDDPGGYVRRVAMLIRDAALALQAVHDQGLMHRDVKPGNLMLTADGSRVVLMDFGLAKGQSVTRSVGRGGGLLGTLRYAAPEQLAAANVPVGPAADVRGLGVTLWELLTRRRLFAEAEDENRLAQMVLAAETPRLRTVDPGLDRDLEAITARATERLAADRIPTAARLAAYLQLYLDGKPLPIRPPGALELAGRWVRRNRVLVAAAAFAAAAAAASVVVAFVQITLAWQSAARLADDNQKLAEAKGKLAADNGELAAAEAKLAADNGELADKETKAREKVEEALAVGLLRPIGRDRGKVDPVELNDLWELAALPKEQDRIRVLFLDRALDRPETAAQLGRRAAMAVHAAVGLDLRRKEEVLRMLLPHLRDRGADLRVRTAGAVAAAELAPLPEEEADAAAAALVEGTASADDPADRDAYLQALDAAAPRLSAPGAEAAAGGVLDALALSPGPAKLRDLARALAVIAPRMGEDAAHPATEKAAQKILDGMEKTSDANQLRNLSLALEAVAPRMGPGGAKEAAADILYDMADTQNAEQLQNLSAALGVVAARLDADGAGATSQELFRNMREIRFEQTKLGLFAAALAAVAPRMDEKAAAAASQQLLDELARASELYEFRDLIQMLAAVAPRMDPGQAEAAAPKVLDAMAKTTDADLLLGYAQALGSSRMGDAAAHRAAAAAARTILDAMSKTSSPDSVRQLIRALEGAAPGMDEATARDTTAAGVRTLLGATEPAFSAPDRDQELARALAAVAAHGNEAAAAAAVRTILDAMAKAPDADQRRRLTAPLAVVAARADAGSARAAAERIVSEMAEDSGGPSQLLSVLGPVLDHLDADAARQTADDAGRKVLNAMAKSADLFVLRNLAKDLGSIADRMDDAAAHKAAAAAAQWILAVAGGLPDSYRLEDLPPALGAIAAHLDADGAAESAQGILALLAPTSDPDRLRDLAQALGAVAGRIDAAGAAAAAPTVLDAMAKTSDPDRLRPLAEALRAVAGRLDDAAAHRATAAAALTLLDAMAKTSDPDRLCNLARALGVLASRRDEAGAQKASVAAQAILVAMGQTSDVTRLRDLGQALGAVASCMDEAPARKTTAVAVRIILSVMAKTSESYKLRDLSLALGGVAPRMDEATDAAAVRAILDAMMHATDSDPAGKFVAALGPVAARMDGVAAAEWILDARAETASELRADELLQAFRAVLAGRSGPEMVTILKHPACVGPARAAVLDQLGRRQNHPFDGVWELVDWLAEHDPEIDVAGPAEAPRRPGSMEPKVP